MRKSRKKWKQLLAITLSIGMTVVPPASSLNMIYAETMEQAMEQGQTAGEASDNVGDVTDGTENEGTTDVTGDTTDETIDDTSDGDTTDVTDGTEDGDTTDVTDDTEDGDTADVTDDAEDGDTADVTDDTEDGDTADVTDDTEDGDTEDVTAGTAGETADGEKTDVTGETAEGTVNESEEAGGSGSDVKDDGADDTLKETEEEKLDSEDLVNDLEDTIYISEFKALHTVAYEFNKKPELDTLLGYFPKQLKAIVEDDEIASSSDADTETIREIPVTWECELDYANTEATEYIFYPTWDELGYEIADADSIPEIRVVLLNIAEGNVILTAEVDDMEVTVTAEAGVLPEGAELKVVKVEDRERVAELTDAIEQELDKEDKQETLEDTLVLDVSIYDKDGNAIQPDTSKGTVTVTFRNVEAARAEDAEDTLEVYHFAEEDVESVKKEDATVSDGTVECDIEHFSEFVIGRKKAKNAAVITTAAELKNAISEANDGDELDLKLGEGTFDLGSDTITIDKNIKLTLTGAGRDATVIKSSVAYAAENGVIAMTGTSEATLSLKNLKIESTNGNAIAFRDTAKANLSMDNVELLVFKRGVSYGYDGTVSGNTLNIKDSNILNSQISEYTTDTMIDGSCRGISLYDMVETQVTLTNSAIKGFGYSINVSGDADAASGVADTHDLEVTLDECEVYGWTSFNVWGSLATYNVINTEIIGINKSNDYSFSAMTFNDDIYSQFGDAHAVNNTLNITDSTIKNCQVGSCTEELLRIDCGITKLNLSGKVTFEDATGNIDSALYLDHMSDPVDFIDNHVNVEGATIICKGEGGKELLFAPVIINTYKENEEVKTACFSSLESAVKGVDYETAVACKETLILMKDISEPDFAVNDSEGHGYKWGGWTLDLAGHSLTVGGWETGGKQVSIKDTSADKTGKIYVNGTNIIAAKAGDNCYLKIADAISAAAEGETVLVSPGTYDEPIVITEIKKNVTLKADGEVTLKGGITGTGNADGLTIEGFKFEEKPIHATWITTTKSDVITIKNNKFAGVKAPGTKKGAINITGNTGCVIEKNEITGNATDTEYVAVYLPSVKALEFKDNHIKDITGTGLNAIVMDAGASATITGNTFENWANAGGAGRAMRLSGFKADRSTQWTITGNTMIKDAPYNEAFIKLDYLGSKDHADMTNNFWDGYDPLVTKSTDGKYLAEVYAGEEIDTSMTDLKIYPLMNSVGGNITYIKGYISGDDAVFANGTPIVIEEVDGQTYVHPASSTTKETDWIAIPETTEVFAGSLEGNVSSGSITMQSGSVRYLCGNSKGAGKVGTSTIVMNGGTVGIIYGHRGGKTMGGGTSFDDAENYAVGTMNVTVNGGTLGAVIGAFGNSHIDDVNVTINGGTITAQTSPVQAAVLLAGSNGTVGNAALEVTGGDLHNIALMQRTLVSGTASVTVTGGKVGNIYAGSYYDDGESYAGCGWWDIKNKDWGKGWINYGQAQNIEITVGANADYDDIYAGFQFDSAEAIKEAQSRAGADLPMIADFDGARVKLNLYKAPKAAVSGKNVHSQSLTKEYRDYVDYIFMAAEKPVAYIENANQHMEFNTFEDMFQAVKAGDTVHILPGTYGDELDALESLYDALPGPLTFKADGEVTLAGGLYMPTEGDLTIDGFIFTKAARIIQTGSGKVIVKNNIFKDGASLITRVEGDETAAAVVEIINNRFSDWKHLLEDEQTHAMYLSDESGNTSWTIKDNLMTYTGTVPNSYVQAVGVNNEKTDLTYNYWSGDDPLRAKAQNGKPLAEVIPDAENEAVYTAKAKVYPAYKTTAMSTTDIIEDYTKAQVVAKPVENQAEVTVETVKKPDTAAAENKVVEAAQKVLEGQELTEEVKEVLVQKVAEAAAPEKVAEETNKVVEQLVSNSAVAAAPAEGLKEAVVMDELKEILDTKMDSVSVYVKPVLKEVAMELEVTAGATLDEVSVKLVPSVVTFEVSPYLVQYDENKETLGEEKKIDNKYLSGKVKFRLPIPEAVNRPYARILHVSEQGGTSTYYAEIHGTGSEKYIEVEVGHFSQFVVNFVDEVPTTTTHHSSGGGGGSKFVNTSTGRWIQDAKGWWYSYTAGGYPNNGWAYLYYGNKYGWYYFDVNGYLVSGWVTPADGNQYYLNPNHDGYFGIMLTGWVQIDGKWYYFAPETGGPMGALLKNTTTPDGYRVNEKGERVE